MDVYGLRAQVAMPGSCGELVQGTLGESDFHITWPVNRYSVVSARPTSGEVSITGKSGRTIKEGRIINAGTGQAKDAARLDHASLEKTALAVTKAIEKVRAGLDLEVGVRIEVESELAPGKGMASSTADIASAIVAVNVLFDKAIDAKQIAEVALSVEPTDGTFFEGIVAFDHLKGRFFEEIGDAPPIDVVVLEPPQTLDTIAFNREKLAANNDLFVKEAYEMAVSGIRDFNLKLIGEAATLSAMLNQSRLLKPELNDVIALSRRKGALGVNVAHSGTVMGILVERGFGDKMFSKVSHYVPKGWQAYVVSVIGGGPRMFAGKGFEMLNQPVGAEKR